MSVKPIEQNIYESIIAKRAALTECKYTEGKSEEYQKFFNAKLKKYGVDSPDKLEGDKKKKFFDEIDKEWKGEDE